MIMLINVLKAFLIGICASIPFGPIAVLVIQKTLNYGHKIGFISGLGATLSDTTYATISLLAFAVAEAFIDEHEVAILLAGGAVVVLVGISMLLKDPLSIAKPDPGHEPGVKIGAQSWAQAYASAVSNPGSILVIFFLISILGLSAEPTFMETAPVILAFAAGSATYWFLLSWMFNIFRKHFRVGTVIRLSRLTAVGVVAFGAFFIADGLFNLFK